MKSLLFKSPEYYLLVLIFLAGYTYPFTFQPFHAVLGGLILLQIIFRNAYTGLILSALFFVVNFLFLGALISEFSEFSEFNSAAKKLIFTGGAIWIANCAMACLMGLNYLKMLTTKSNLAIDHNPI
ncbi:MAG: hypothetical protein HRT74_10575 [Flavobacteriales bacterium]|nr:hypothetical protein [Flavobacteriales bacterium]